ncbi:MAG: Do family serine endopeptidase [Myxococcota bacterium]|nr:Do family serine endopeptidase [Myxococcota bacterium]
MALLWIRPGSTALSLLLVLLATSVSLAAPTNLPDVAERAVKSVVNIASTKKLVSRRGMLADPLFRRFFGDRGGIPEQKNNSLGSGVVISADGLILTNSHVVHETTDIKVTTADGKEFDATIVGTDPKSDVAVLRIDGDASGLTPMPVGDSKRLRLGETVIAIGNPFGLGHTVTMGIVSAKGRANMGITEYEDFIQTDAAINPGNSGGALVNLKGELVGINTAIVSRSGGYQGIGFAIPTDMAVAIKKSLVATGTVRRGWLGISIQPLDRRLSAHLGVQAGTQGVLVAGVLDGTPAQKAGLQSGDVILTVDGKQTRSPAALRNTIAMKGQGQTTEIKYIRDGRERSITVVLGELDSPSAKMDPPQSSGNPTQFRGLDIQRVDRSWRKRLGLNSAVSGVVVTGVDPGSAAQRAGIKQGDIIVSIDRKPTRTVNSVQKALRGQAGDVLVRIRRGESSSYVVLGTDSGE